MAKKYVGASIYIEAPTARNGAADPRFRCFRVAETWLTETLIHSISQWGDNRKKYSNFCCAVVTNARSR